MIRGKINVLADEQPNGRGRAKLVKKTSELPTMLDQVASPIGQSLSISDKQGNLLCVILPLSEHASPAEKKTAITMRRPYKKKTFGSTYTKTTDRDSLRYTYNGTRRVRQLALGCESN